MQTTNSVDIKTSAALRVGWLIVFANGTSITRTAHSEAEAKKNGKGRVGETRKESQKKERTKEEEEDDNIIIVSEEEAEKVKRELTRREREGEGVDSRVELRLRCHRLSTSLHPAPPPRCQIE